MGNLFPTRTILEKCNYNVKNLKKDAKNNRTNLRMSLIKTSHPSHMSLFLNLDYS